MRVAARVAFLAVALGASLQVAAGPYAPAPPQAGQPANGSTAIAATDPRIAGWATGYVNFAPGPVQIGTYSTPASYGAPENALGPADATTDDPSPVVSLGDGGSITLTFSKPIANGPGFDFAVYENAFNDTFLELAFVEVSSDGVNFVRFPSVSLTPTTTQVNGESSKAFGSVDPTNLNDLAGKYRAGFGTPFDLQELAGLPGSTALDLNDIEYVRIVDVVGDIDPTYGTRDSKGHLINDPWPTPYPSSGFDLDAVGILNTVPEPAPPWLLGLSLLAMVSRRRR